MVLPAVAPPQEGAPSERRQVDRYKIRVSVDMVVLHATLRNRKGTPVAGRGKGDFQVYEDRVLQEIKYFTHEDIPVTVGQPDPKKICTSHVERQNLTMRTHGRCFAASVWHYDLLGWRPLRIEPEMAFRRKAP